MISPEEAARAEAEEKKAKEEDKLKAAEKKTDADKAAEKKAQDEEKALQDENKDTGTSLTPEGDEDDEDDEETTLKAKPEKKRSAVEDLDTDKPGKDFWDLFWTVLMALTDPKTTWAFLPQFVKAPIVATAQAVVDGAKYLGVKFDEKIITPIVDTKNAIIDGTIDVKDRIVDGTKEGLASGLKKVTDAFSRQRADCDLESGHKEGIMKYKDLQDEKLADRPRSFSAPADPDVKPDTPPSADADEHNRRRSIP